LPRRAQFFQRGVIIDLAGGYIAPQRLDEFRNNNRGLVAKLAQYESLGDLDALKANLAAPDPAKLAATETKPRRCRSRPRPAGGGASGTQGKPDHDGRTVIRPDQIGDHAEAVAKGPGPTPGTTYGYWTNR
jgi:hypothetical protein